MSRLLFVDTSGWYAAFNRADAWHSKVAQVLREAAKKKRQLVTTSDVLDESLTLIRTRAGLALALQFGEAVWWGGGAEVIDVEHEAREMAWSIFAKYADHTLSFTDCTSAAVMQSRGIEEALTLDHHFQILGFTLLPHRGD